MSYDELRARDEVLQVMYWMLGEGIAHEVDAAYVSRFLAEDEPVVAAALAALQTRGLALHGGRPGAYRLSEQGIREGGRRFQDEFGDLTRQPHGECMPGCECHRPSGEGRPCPSLVPVASGG